MTETVEPGYVRSAAYELTRPSDTTAYASGDAMANSDTAASVVPMEFEVAMGANGGTGLVIGARLLTNSATAFGSMRLHLFNRAPFAAAGYQADNAALALTYIAMKDGEGAATNPNDNYIGSIDFTTFVAHSSSARSIGTCDQTELEFRTKPGSNKIYGLLEARAAITPASAQTFNVILSVRGIS